MLISYHLPVLHLVEFDFLGAGTQIKATSQGFATGLSFHRSLEFYACSFPVKVIDRQADGDWDGVPIAGFYVFFLSI